MKKTLCLAAFVLLFAAMGQAQCSNCTAVEGHRADHCYTSDDAPDLCAQFNTEKHVFLFEDKGEKKKRQIREIKLPGGGIVDRDYLLSLQEEKKLKLDAGDLLFIEEAVKNWMLHRALRQWDEEVLQSGINITPSGLGYHVLQPGNGATPKMGQRVTVHYTGWLQNGDKFDSSLDRGQTFSFNLGKGMVIKGWDEGVAMMPIGSTFLLRIPADLGYGDRGIGPIPANSVLWFEVQLLSAE